MQQLTMEANYDDFKIVEKYLKSLPRPSKHELHALDQKLIQRGQQIPIIVNSNMEILDGHTRHDLLGQRGKKIKYEIRDFPDKESEFEFVVETNVMKRQLNIFQRVEVMYEFYIQTKLEKRINNREVHFDIFRAIKEGAKSTDEIVKYTKYSLKGIGRLLKQLTDSYYISRELDSMEKGRGTGNKKYIYSLLPKGSEMLEKSEPRRLGSSMDLLSEVVGASEPSVRCAITIIKYGDEELINRCRSGSLSVYSAIKFVKGFNVGRKSTRQKSWTSRSKIKCPHCHHISQKNEFEVIE